MTEGQIQGAPVRGYRPHISNDPEPAQAESERFRRPRDIVLPSVHPSTKKWRVSAMLAARRPSVIAHFDMYKSPNFNLVGR